MENPARLSHAPWLMGFVAVSLLTAMAAVLVPATPLAIATLVAVIVTFAVTMANLDAGFAMLGIGAALGGGLGAGSALGLAIALPFTGIAKPIGARARPLLLMSSSIVAIGVLSWVVNARPSDAVTSWIVPLLFRVAFLFLVAMFGQRKETRKALLVGLLIAAVVQSIVGLLQWQGVIPSTSETYLPNGEVSLRAGGLEGDPNYYALDLATAVCFAMAAFRTRTLRTMALLILPISMGAIFASLSRSALLAVCAGIATYAVMVIRRRGPASRRGTMRLMVGLAALAVAAFFVAPTALLGRFEEVQSGAPSASTSTGQRLMLWDGAWNLFVSAPLIGVGPDQTRHHLAVVQPGRLGRPQSAHSTPLDMAADLGAPGLTLWILFVACLCVAAWKAGGEKRGEEAALEGLTPALAAYTVGSLLVTAYLTSTFWVSAAIIVSYFAGEGTNRSARS